MPLAPGFKLGPYEILVPLGAGGMGEVYRAKDTRLDRIVAIKILPLQFTADPVAQQRFEREAKTISSLNHPHICVLYDIGHQDGTDFIVMECLEGETLAKRLEKGPLSTDQGLKFAAQIAEALDKAHRSGIVHRDLKPGNIMLTATGAKLLDFGLAKELSPLASLATLTTLSDSPVTQEGTIVGTFQYMSPEQIEGKPVDGRSDIFSLGSVLYEMLTGRRAFEGKTQLSVASAIVEREPEPLSRLRPLTPPALERLVQRCLGKDPEDRWQSGRDLASELNWISQSGSQSFAPAVTLEAKATTNWRKVLPWALGAALAAALLVSPFLWHGSQSATPTSYYSAPFRFPARGMAVAPNGHTVAVVGYRQSDRANIIFLYEAGSRDVKTLSGTEGATFPFWSPDGKSLGFFADGKLKKMDAIGGPVQIIGDAPTGRGGTWNKDGVIVFTPSGALIDGLYRISSGGGPAVRITTPEAEENTHRWPVFLPDGKHFLYLAANVSGKEDPDAIYAGVLDSDEKKFITKATGNAAYALPGYLLFYRERTLFAQRFDADKLHLIGDPVALLTDVAYSPRIARAAYSVADGGMLVAQSGTGVMVSSLEWYDRKGNELGVAGQPAVYSNIALAPNGKILALDKTDEGNENSDVWTMDLEHDGMKRLTFDPAIDADPVWSPDGKQVLFASSRSHLFGLYVKNADGTEDDKLLPLDASDKSDKYPSDWSRDGRYILYDRATELWVVTLPELKTRPLVKVAATVKNGRFSPDGKWVAYSSNETGKWEIYVTSFPDGHGKWQVSSNGGTQPRWRGDGKELFYLATDGTLMAVATGTNFDPGTPVALFQANARELVATSERSSYDVTGDGKRFLINTQIKNADPQPMSVILNWDAALRK
jgi:eukaryotic-like serine/threonine-protein kinase